MTALPWTVQLANQAADRAYRRGYEDALQSVAPLLEAARVYRDMEPDEGNADFLRARSAVLRAARTFEVNQEKGD